MIGAQRILPTAGIHEIAREVAEALSYSRQTNAHPVVVTPLLYPGGSRVSLGIREMDGGYLVSDFGAGAREADLLGAGRLFPRIAREQARLYDVRFDSDMIFDVHVPREALVTAAIMIANSSKTAVEITALRLADYRHGTELERLLEGIESTLGKINVVREAELAGASSTWRVDALILRPGRRDYIFDLVAANANSVNATVTKFLDLSRQLEEGPERFSVLTDIGRTPHATVLGTTSRLIGLDRAPAVLAA